VIAAALSIQDPRERPSENTEAADRMHARFFDRSSDFMTLLTIWKRFQESRRNLKRKNQLRKYCREHFLSYRRMREWQDIHAQICDILRENRMRPQAELPEASQQRYAAIHRCVLSGFLSNIAEKKEKNLYRAARGREVMIFPGSALFNRAGGWIVAAEMVRTSRLFARTVANIDVAWLESLGGDLCRFTYLNPGWDAGRKEVTATQQVSLFGLIIVTGRTVSYGRIDAEAATEIFIRRALMEDDLPSAPAFLSHNRKCIETVRGIENRIRRRDLLVGDDDIYRFYRNRLGRISSERALLDRIRRRGGDAFLRFNIDDLMLYEPGDAVIEQFPEQVRLGRRKFGCTYRFEPGRREDGLSVKIPLAQAGEVPEDSLDWLVPGMLKEKIAALIKGLPKRYRKRLVPVTETVDRLFEAVADRKGSLVNCLSESIHRLFGLNIPASAWPTDNLPEHLSMRVSIVGPNGEEIHGGREKSILKRDFPGGIQPDAFERARKQWEKTHITAWDFGDLPERIEIAAEGPAPGALFPGLAVDNRDPGRVDLKLFQRPDAALASHLEGVAALYGIYFAKDLKRLQKVLALPSRLKPAARYFGGAEQIASRMVSRVLCTLFRRNIRSADAFYETGEAKMPRLVEAGRRLQEDVLGVLEACAEARSVIERLAEASPQSSPLRNFFEDLESDLMRLVPDNFIELYGAERLRHLPRYIKAAAVRARRAEVHLEKDLAKAQTIQPFSRALQSLLQQLGPDSSTEKRAATEEFFWLIEEFKVSLFAQELKTAVPVSRKRLQERLTEIERMV
jgi:ATP-dependent helicase HrpA